MMCSSCNERVYSPLDKSYLKEFGICWSCDKQRWEKGELNINEFEIKEKKALQMCEE